MARAVEKFAEEQLEFETCDAGASATYPVEAGSLKKGGYVMIKKRPCKIVEYITSKSGKHGHCKVHIVGMDIFTGKKYEELVPSSHNIEVPNVSRNEYQVLSIGASGALSLITPSCELKIDLNLPSETDEDEKVADAIKRKFEDGKIIYVFVLSVCGNEKVVQYRAID